jgi:hypothetical protein
VSLVSNASVVRNGFAEDLGLLALGAILTCWSWADSGESIESLEAKMLRSSMLLLLLLLLLGFPNLTSVTLNYIELVVIKIVILLLILMSNVKITI